MVLLDFFPVQATFLSLSSSVSLVLLLSDDYRGGWKDFRAMGRLGQDEEMQDEEDLYYHDDYVQHQRRKLFSNPLNKKRPSKRRGTNEHDTDGMENLRPGNDSVSEKENQDVLQKQNKMAVKDHQKLQRQNKMADENQHIGWKDEAPGQKEDTKSIGQVNRMKVEDVEEVKAPIQDQRSGAKPHVINFLKNDTRNHFQSTSKQENLQPREDDSFSQRGPHDLAHHRGGYINPPPKHTGDAAPRKGGDFVERGGAKKRDADLAKDDTDLWVMYGDSETDDVIVNKAAFDPEIRWDQTFQVGHTDFQSLRSDWIDLNCNVSGNLLISQSEVTAVVQAYMEKLELKYPRYRLPPMPYNNI